MKNLKRALSFALATVMLIGMMVMGVSAADFGDADEIVNTDAVNTLYALGIVDGKDDGNYDPTGIVTRAEMAKLICVALNGGKAPVLGTKAEPTYTDIKGHWAESYIEYCSSLRIVSGRGDGTFDPGATVTGNEAAKMMLVAMGWDSTIFGFTGANWAINVGVEANKVQLFEDLETIDPSEGLTRDNTAQLVYNGVLAPTMVKSPSMTITNGEVTWNYSLSSKTIFSEKFGGKVFIGTMDGNKKTGATTEDGYIQITGKLDTDDGVTAGQMDRAADFPSDLDIANIGEEVKVLYKEAKNGISNEPDNKDTIYGVFNTGATKVLNATKADIKDNKAAEAKIKVGATKYNTLANVDVYTNYIGTGAAAPVAANNGVASTSNSNLTTALKAANGDTIKFVFDNNNKIAKAYVVTSKLARVTAVNAEKVTLNNGVGTLKLADNDVYEGIAKNDVVVVTTLYHSTATNSAAYNIVEKAEVVSGTVNGYKGTENVVVDGTTYKIYGNTAMTALGLTDEITAFTTGKIGETVDLYMVNGYVYAAAQTSEDATNYSIVIDKNGGTAGSNWTPFKMVVLGADGVKTTLTVDEDSACDTNSDAKIDASDFTAGDIITWTGTEGAALVSKKAVTTTAGDGTTKTYNKTDKTFAGTVTATDAVLFAETTANAYTAGSGTKFKAYAVRDMKDIVAPSGAVIHTYTNSDGKVVAAFVDLTSAPAGATNSAVYGIVSAWTGKIEIDDVEYSVYTIKNDTETYTVQLKTGTLAKGSIYGFAPTTDGKYDNASGFVDLSAASAYTNSSKTIDGTTYTVSTVAVKEYDEAEGLLTYYTGIDGSKNGTGVTTKAVDDEVAIIYVDVDGDTAGEAIGVNGFDGVTGYYNAIILVDSNVITHIIVESSGEGNVFAK